jgi:hypothetical protein
MYPDILLNSALGCFRARPTTECSCAVRIRAELVDVMIRWTSSRPLFRKCHSVPYSSYALIRNTSTTST